VPVEKRCSGDHTNVVFGCVNVNFLAHTPSCASVESSGEAVPVSL
jgi:hypothetical protein